MAVVPFVYYYPVFKQYQTRVTADNSFKRCGIGAVKRPGCLVAVAELLYLTIV